MQNVMVMEGSRKMNFNPKNYHPDMLYITKYTNLKFVTIAHFSRSYIFGGVQFSE